MDLPFEVTANISAGMRRLLIVLLALSLSGCITQGEDGLTEALGMDNTPPECPAGQLADVVLESSVAGSSGSHQMLELSEGCTHFVVSIESITHAGDLTIGLYDRNGAAVKIYYDATGAMVQDAGGYTGQRNGDGAISVEPGTYRIDAQGRGAFRVDVLVVQR